MAILSAAVVKEPLSAIVIVFCVIPPPVFSTSPVMVVVPVPEMAPELVTFSFVAVWYIRVPLLFMAFLLSPPVKVKVPALVMPLAMSSFPALAENSTPLPIDIVFWVMEADLASVKEPPFMFNSPDVAALLLSKAAVMAPFKVTSPALIFNVPSLVTLLNETVPLLMLSAASAVLVTRLFSVIVPAAASSFSPLSAFNSFKFSVPAL